MNRIYKTRFNRRLGVWQVVPETARGGGKSKACVLATTVLLGAVMLGSQPVWADNLLVGAGGAGGAGSDSGGAGGGGGIGGGGGGAWGFGGGGGGGMERGGSGAVGGDISGGNGGGSGGNGGAGGTSGDAATLGPGGLGDIGGGGGGGGLLPGGNPSGDGGGGGAIGASGGSGGSNIGAPSIVGGNGGSNGGGGGAASGDAAGMAGADGSYSPTVLTGPHHTAAAATYDFVGVGGGGGGGGGAPGSQPGQAGAQGDDGTLEINNASLTVNRSLLLGGAGGGSGAGGGGGSGGNGGNGGLLLENGANLGIAETLLVGGSGGGTGGSSTGVAGAGGSGTLTSASGTTISVGGRMIVGGDGGDGSGTAGTGTVNLGGSLAFGAGAGLTIRTGSTFNVGGAPGGTTDGITGLGSLQNAGTLNFNQTNTTTLSADISGSGAFNQNGTGITILTGNNSYSGATSINAGGLQVGDGNTTGTLGSGNVANNGALYFDRRDTHTVGNIISGSGSVTQLGTGTLVLSGVNSYSGDTRIASGELSVTNGSALGTGLIAMDGGKLSSTTSLTLNNDIWFADGKTSNITAAAGTTMRLTGPVNVGIDSVATFGTSGVDSTVLVDWVSGGSLATSLHVLGGTVGGQIGVLASFGYGTTVDAGATLDLSETASGPPTIINLLGAGTVRTSSTPGTLLGLSRGNFAGTIVGGSTLDVTGSSTDLLVLTGSNSYTGGTIVSSGTLQIGNGSGTGTLGSGDIRIEQDGLLDFFRAGISTVAGDIGTTTAGHLRVRGGGTVVLTGTNSYTDTTIEASTLQVGAGGLTGSLGTGTVTNNGMLDFHRDGTLVVANTITGIGRVRQSGPGMVELSGSNDYSGGTAIHGGTLSIAADANLGAASGALELDGGTLRTTAAFGTTRTVTLAGNGTFRVDGASLALDSAVSGGGNLVKEGAGTLVLSADNNYAGTTTVSSGIVQVGNGGATGSLGAGAVTNNGQLRFDRGNDFTVSNAIGGTGALAKLGASTMILTGSNSYTGTTTIAAGTLQVGDGDATGSLGTGAVVNNGHLVFDRNNDFTVVSAIGGTGTLRKLGTGTMILTGSSDYTGTTTVAAGTLQVGDGGTQGSLGTGNVTNNAALAFNRSDRVSVANVVNGTGSLTQAGSGNLVLTGANTYTGGTFVNAGTLSVNGSIVGNTTVNSGGALGGTGTVGNVLVASGGTIAPGNSIGTLSVNGSLTFAPGSIYRVEANSAGAADRVNAVGAGTITINGGTVDVQAGGAGYQRNTRYTILSSGGATTGRFASATTNLAFLTPTLIYEANAVLLDLQSSDVADYGSAARTPNQRAVANYLQSFADTPSNAQASGLIQQIDNMTADQAAASFESIAGSAHASASQVASALGRNFSATLAARSGFGTAGLGNAMNDWSRVRYASLAPVHAPQGLDQERGFWAQTQGAGGRLDADGNASGSRYGSSGIVLGYDQPLTGRWLAGAALGYSTSHWNSTSGDSASGRIESPQAGLYARYAGDAIRVRIDGTFARHDFITDRTVRVGTASASTNSKHKGREWGLAGQVEMPIQAGDWELRPLAGVRYAHLKEDAFDETGQGSANLSVAGRSTQNTLVSSGMHFVRMFKQGKGGIELRAVASHLAGDNDSPVTASIAGQPGSFTASGVPLKRDALALGATVSGEVARNVSAYTDANYEIRGSGQDAYRLTAGVRVSF